MPASLNQRKGAPLLKAVCEIQTLRTQHRASHSSCLTCTAVPEDAMTKSMKTTVDSYCSEINVGIRENASKSRLRKGRSQEYRQKRFIVLCAYCELQLSLSMINRSSHMITITICLAESISSPRQGILMD